MGGGGKLLRSLELDQFGGNPQTGVSPSLLLVRSVVSVESI